MQGKRLVSAREFIRLTGVKRATFFDRLKKGKVPYFLVGKSDRKWFDLEMEVKKWTR